MDTTKNNDITQQCIQYIKDNQVGFIEKFASIENHPAQDQAHTIFMAGAPGAGKTEVSKSIIATIEPLRKAVRIDADEIKEWIPLYTDTNATEVQDASVLGLVKLYDHVLKYKQHAIIDGTFSSYKYAKENIDRSLKNNRPVHIIYVYQDPRYAWILTQVRALEQKRTIPKAYFIDTYIKSIETVNRIKQEFGNRITLDFIQKDYNHNIERYHSNIESVDGYIKTTYTRESLESIL